MKKTALLKMAAVVGLVGVMAITPDLVPTTARIVNGAEASPSEMESTPSDIGGGGSTESGTTGGATSGSTTGGNTSGSGTTNPGNTVTNPDINTPSDAPDAPDDLKKYFGIGGGKGDPKVGDEIEHFISYLSNSSPSWVDMDTVEWSIDDPSIGEIVTNPSGTDRAIYRIVGDGHTAVRVSFEAEVEGTTYFFEYHGGFGTNQQPCWLDYTGDIKLLDQPCHLELVPYDDNTRIISVEWTTKNPDILKYDPVPSSTDAEAYVYGLKEGTGFVYAKGFCEVNGVRKKFGLGKYIEVFNPGWVKNENGWFYVENGEMVKQDWRKDSSNSLWYLEADGYWRGWMKDSIGWKFQENGSFVKNEYRVFEGTSYYLGSDGYRTAPPSGGDSSSSDDDTPAASNAPTAEQALMQVYRACSQAVDANTASGAGWAQDPATGNWTFTLNSVPVINQIMKIENPYIPGNMAGYFYFDTNGVLASGWQFINGSWYYFNTVHNGWYGAMYINTITPDGYKVGPDGKWIPDQQ